MRSQLSNRIALGVCLSFIVLAISYASITPPFEAPDEASHFLYAHNLLQERRLPILEDRATVFASQSTQRHHPPLYYLIGATLMSWTSRTDIDSYLQPNPYASIGTVTVNNQNAYLHPLAYAGDTGVAIWIMRLFSIGLGAVTLWFVYRIGCEAFGRASIGLTAMLLTMSIPQFLFMTSSVNNDNLVTALYTIGIYYAVKLWQQRAITWRDTLMIGLVLAASALSKLTGLSLFGVMYGAAIAGAVFKRLAWRDAVRLIAVTLVIAGVLSGWWYVRNWQVYGDPLALQATLTIWGRGNTPITGSEVYAIWESFWMVLGNFNVRGPDWLYGYANLMTLAGLIGAGVLFVRMPNRRAVLAFLALVCVLIAVSVLAATRQINVSQGRLLFPAISALACLLAAGWHTLLRSRSAVVMLPITLLALFVPTMYLRPAYMPLIAVDTLPSSAQALNVKAETLQIRGYEVMSDVVADDNVIRLRLYFAGVHQDNPRLFVKAVESAVGGVVGSLDMYPGMAPTAALHDAIQLYRADINLKIDPALLTSPRQINLLLGWNAEERYIPLIRDGQLLAGVVLDGPSWANIPTPIPPEMPVKVVFGDAIELVGYTLPAREFLPAESISITLQWQCNRAITEALSMALGILDSSNQMVAQADGIPLGYPPTAWQCGKVFTDTRTLTLPANAMDGDYKLYFGWYKLSDGTRLAVKSDQLAHANNLVEIGIRVNAKKLQTPSPSK